MWDVYLGYGLQSPPSPLRNRGYIHELMLMMMTLGRDLQLLEHMLLTFRVAGQLIQRALCKMYGRAGDVYAIICFRTSCTSSVK
jgi:hypothetical protein